MPERKYDGGFEERERAAAKTYYDNYREEICQRKRDARAASPELAAQQRETSRANYELDKLRAEVDPEFKRSWLAKAAERARAYRARLKAKKEGRD